ncbi:MAG: hypothetical protein U9Q66_00940 [Patescibacteria group bacterium]|nr:hypothetical protein [Patescibacteria group bacterium]
MNQLSVEKNIKIYPEVKTNLVWVDNKTLKIEVTDEIEEETDFIVNILDDALNIN